MQQIPGFGARFHILSHAIWRWAAAIVFWRIHMPPMACALPEVLAVITRVHHTHIETDLEMRSFFTMKISYISLIGIKKICDKKDDCMIELSMLARQHISFEIVPGMPHATDL